MTTECPLQVKALIREPLVLVGAKYFVCIDIILLFFG